MALCCPLLDTPSFKASPGCTVPNPSESHCLQRHTLPRQAKASLLPVPEAEGLAEQPVTHLCPKDQSHVLPAHTLRDSGSNTNRVFLSCYPEDAKFAAL